jgi:hypothetical protein
MTSLDSERVTRLLVSHVNSAFSENQTIKKAVVSEIYIVMSCNDFQDFRVSNGPF